MPVLVDGERTVADSWAIALYLEEACPGGKEPTDADSIVFGGFQWARCVSRFALLADSDPIAAWRDRILDRFGGLARKAEGAA